MLKILTLIVQKAVKCVKLAENLVKTLGAEAPTCIFTRFP